MIWLLIWSETRKVEGGEGRGGEGRGGKGRGYIINQILSC